MITLLTILHVVVSLFLIAIVLLQHGKGADMGATFGGSGQTVFGTDGPLPLLNKVTTGAAIVFMITSVTLAYNSAHSSRGSVMKALRPVQSSPAGQGLNIAPAPGSEVPTSQPLTETAPTSSEFPGAPAAPEAASETPGSNTKEPILQEDAIPASPEETTTEEAPAKAAN